MSEAEAPDPSFVDLHRMARERVEVERIVGRAWRVLEGGRLVPLAVGDPIETGHVVAVAPGSEVFAEGLFLDGGKRGRTHSLVPGAAFRPSPSRADVPKLLRQLAQIEQEIQDKGNDPLAAAQTPPATPHEVAQAAEFARMNLSRAAGRLLPEQVARSVGAVVLFVSEETAFVAFESVSVGKLRQVMEALERPIHSHLIPEGLLPELMDAVYTTGADAPS